MKRKLFYISVLTLFIAFSSCGSNNQKVEDKKEVQATNTQYTCEMHPEVISDRPGKCPKCGMDLIEDKRENDTLKTQQNDTLKTQQNDTLKVQ